VFKTLWISIIFIACGAIASSFATTDQSIQPNELIGVWTTSDNGPNHLMEPDKITKNCQSFKMVIHADLRVEAITQGNDGGYMFWAVAETPCSLKDNMLACAMTVYTERRVISVNKPVAWSLSRIRDGVYDSTTMIGNDVTDTMYRCDQKIQDTSLITSRTKI